MWITIIRIFKLRKIFIKFVNIIIRKWNCLNEAMNVRDTYIDRGVLKKKKKKKNEKKKFDKTNSRKKKKRWMLVGHS